MNIEEKRCPGSFFLSNNKLFTTKARRNMKILSLTANAHEFTPMIVYEQQRTLKTPIFWMFSIYCHLFSVSSPDVHRDRWLPGPHV